MMKDWGFGWFELVGDCVRGEDSVGLVSEIACCGLDVDVDVNNEKLKMLTILTRVSRAKLQARVETSRLEIGKSRDCPIGPPVHE